MTESLDDQIGLSISNHEFEQLGCMFCQQEELDFPAMINTALYEKHTNSPQAYCTRDINDILENRLCEPAVKYNQMMVLSDDEQFLKRSYLQSQYNRKITALGEYYKFHTDVPRIHAMPVERTLARYYDRRRELEYKQVKRMMNEDQRGKSVDSMMASIMEHSSFVRKSRYSTMLEGVRKSFDRMDREQDAKLADLGEKSESVALLEVYDKLSEIVKAVPEMTDMPSSYLQNSGVRNFQNWIKHSISTKKIRRLNVHNSPHVQPDFTKKKLDFSNNSSKKKLILKYSNRNSVYNTLNMDYKKVLQTKHMTAGVTNMISNSTKTQKPLMKMTEYIGSVPLKLADKERSIEKIYGVDVSNGKPVRVFQRLIIPEKRYQDSTNGSSNRIEVGRSKSIDKAVLDKFNTDRMQIQQNVNQLTKQQPKRPLSVPKTQKKVRSLSKPNLRRQATPTQSQKTQRAQQRPSSVNLALKPQKPRKSLSVATIKQQLKPNRVKSIQTHNRRTLDIDFKKPKKSLNQLQMVQIMIEKKAKIDPTTVYKKIKHIK